MATFRFLHTDFWKDNFFMELTPEDKYFFIYLLTNDRCTQCGIYNLGVKFAAVELGYSLDTVKTLLTRFVNHGKILYNEQNGEIMILNWYKYNLNINNKNSRVCINTCLKKVKTLEFIKNLYTLCCDTYKGEMTLVNELFSGVNFSMYRDTLSILQLSKESSIDTQPCDNGAIDLKDNTDSFGENPENTVDKSIEPTNYCDQSVDKLEENMILCGKPSPYTKEEKAVLDIFNNNFHPITPIELEKLMDWCNKVSPKVVIKSIEIATLSNKKNMTYLNGILRNWFEGGIRNIDDYERVCKEIDLAKAREKDKKELPGSHYKVLPNDKYDYEEVF